MNFQKLYSLAEEGKIKITSIVPNPKKKEETDLDYEKIDLTQSAKDVNSHGTVCHISAEFFFVNGVMEPVKVIYALYKEGSNKFENYYEIIFKEYNVSELAELLGWTEDYDVKDIEVFIDNILKITEEFKYTQAGKTITQKRFSIGNYVNNAKNEQNYYLAFDKTFFGTFEELVDEVKKRSENITTVGA